MPQMDKLIHMEHMFAMATTIAIIYGHETSYGMMKIVETIKLRQFYMTFFHRVTIKLSEEQTIVKSFIQNTLLYKNIV